MADSIPAHWDLITAGDGVTYWPEDTAQLSTYRWAPVGTYTGNRGKSDAEILEMGEVRRAAVITLPGGQPAEWAQAWVRWASEGPKTGREVVAELLAAALHAEEVDHG